MEICWNDHLGTFHSLSAPQPPKNGGFLNRVAQILLQRSRNWTLQAFFKRCRQIVRTTSCYFKFALQSRQVKRTPQDSINELNIWKMNPLIVPVTIVKFKSAFLHAQWAVNILWELPCIWSDWKSLNGLNLLEDIYIKFRETELVEIS